MAGFVRQVVVVGGGTAGWLAASYLAARRPELTVTLVEAPDIAPLGVGEGSWPTLRETLASIGIAEAEFLRECDASFKQGSRFDGWRDGSAGDSYLHPFTAPPPEPMAELLAAWQAAPQPLPFAVAMTAQAAACARDLAPRQRAMPDYAGALTYGYHLDAGKFAALLARHATTRLGVRRIAARVDGVKGCVDGTIAALQLADGTVVPGDLFIDCSGQAARLIGGHCGVGWVDRSDVSFNDRALALQVPVAPDSAVAAQTVGTAHEAGWLWDIALPTRRGIGCVFSSRFMDEGAAERVLRDYVARHLPDTDQSALTPRLLSFATGHRERFWAGNCLAIGQSAGFIEPLEASAIVMIELSLRALIDSLPVSAAAMPVAAARFNELFRYRWERIVEFLKLHYLLSERPEPYWLAQRDPATVPARLAENLQLWRERPPSARDFPQVDEVFSAASQHYVLYGMGFAPPAALPQPGPAAQRRLAEVAARARAAAAELPTNRAYLAMLRQSPSALAGASSAP
ncbi:MAG: tryptophan 7-halogenase [Proteobacteria bacterium]|nr:tryptophan 7-halogenase [Pseudomonadota bacterium]